MGTNYYISVENHHACPECAPTKEILHIGKSSAGWCFSLHVTDSIKSLDDWRDNWSRPRVKIEDEYGDIITPETMENIITNRSWRGNRQWSQQEFDMNYAEPGPNGLVRYKVDSAHCVGHGDGTWDLITGEFS